MAFKMKKQIIILGNGFDLACGLKSRYADFFKNRFEKLFGKKDHDEIRKALTNEDELKQSVNIKKDYFAEVANKYNNENITRWDIIFLFAEKYMNNEQENWNDIENMISKIITIAADPYGEGYFFHDTAMEKIVRMFSGSSDTDESGDRERIKVLFHSLLAFEKVFSNYIYDQVSNNKEFISKANDLLNKLIKYKGKNDRVDIISFNYSLNESTKRFLPANINSWTNIHGVAGYDKLSMKNFFSKNSQNIVDTIPSPVFGIDNHDIKNSNDLRISFTKSYRLLNNNINNIRSKVDYTGTDLITIYGHSLGRADYSYFETLFDLNNMYNSNTVLQYYYYPGSNEIESRQKYTKLLMNLLTEYGLSLSNIHGENIVNKLILEQRIEILPTNN